MVILMLRDPRDVLVSEYYSIAYSHAAPYGPSAKYDEFLKQRQAAQSMTIDEYVISDSERLHEILRRYTLVLLDKHPHVYVTTYEQMVTDFQRWLTNLFDRCELRVSAELSERLLRENECLRPQNEDVRRHLRKGQSGDYREKLQKKTIDYLNAKFEPVLKEFGYE
jgi:hypothetical protein